MQRFVQLAMKSMRRGFESWDATLVPVSTELLSADALGTGEVTEEWAASRTVPGSK